MRDSREAEKENLREQMNHSIDVDGLLEEDLIDPYG